MSSHLDRNWRLLRAVMAMLPLALLIVLAYIGQAIAGIIAAAACYGLHAIEFAIILRRTRSRNLPDAVVFKNTLIFGFAYWVPLLRSTNGRSSSMDESPQ